MGRLWNLIRWIASFGAALKGLLEGNIGSVIVGAVLGAIIGGICATPTFIYGKSKNNEDELFGLGVITVICGAIGGLILALPAGIITFIIAVNKSGPKDKSH